MTRADEHTPLASSFHVRRLILLTGEKIRVNFLVNATRSMDSFRSFLLCLRDLGFVIVFFDHVYSIRTSYFIDPFC